MVREATQNLRFVDRWLEAAAVPDLVVSSIKWSLVLGVFFVVFWILEARAGADKRRYWSVNFLNDVIYTLFYQGGFYNIFLSAAVINAFRPHLAFFEIGVLKVVPSPADFVLYWLIADFLGYWVHRLEHTVPLLWSFHSVHHSQEKLTFLSTFRNHPLEAVFANVVMLIPVMLLGIPAGTWIGLYMIQMAFEAAQHSELDWSYGRLYPVIVSPRFHSFHHAIDPQYHHKNFSKVLAVWDYAFGTAATGPRPSRFGVDGHGMRENLISQLFHPFRMVYDHARGRKVPISRSEISEKPPEH